MFRFCGYELELFVDRVLIRRHEDPEVCSATDATGQHWLIVAGIVEPLNRSWVCAPVNPHTVALVESGGMTPAEAVAHSPSGWAEVVSVVDGHSVPDRRIAVAELQSGRLAPLLLAS